jgi:hypothetical protein
MNNQFETKSKLITVFLVSIVLLMAASLAAAAFAVDKPPVKPDHVEFCSDFPCPGPGSDICQFIVAQGAPRSSCQAYGQGFFCVP